MSPGEAAKRVDLLGLGRFASARDLRLPTFADRLFRDLAPEHDSFAVRFVGDRTMRRLNLAFRGKDRTTDVLSFPGQTTAEGHHLGDVVISVPQAARQAAERGEPVGRELRTLMLHGLLHCLGHDHETDDGEMERLERRLRNRYLARD